MTATNMKEVMISDEDRVSLDKRPGVTLTISEPHKDYRSLMSDAGRSGIHGDLRTVSGGLQERIDRRRWEPIDPSAVIVSQGSVNLGDVVDEDEPIP